MNLNKDKLYLLKEVLENIRKKGITESIYCNIFDIITLKNNEIDLVDYVSTDKIETAAFLSNHNLIAFNKESLDSFIEKNIKYSKEVFDGVDENELKVYMPVSICIHEMEHANQYLIGLGKIDAPYKIIKEGYNIIYDYLNNGKDKNFKRNIFKYKYKKHREFNIIERNAQLESFKICADLANLENNYNVENLMNKIVINYSKLGYIFSALGCFGETFINSFLLKEYLSIDKTEMISEEDRIRYGLTINESTRIKLLEKK